MVAIIDEKFEELQSLCKAHGVTKLELFGSAATGDFDQSRSDLDFLVEFQRLKTMNSFQQFFGLQIALEELFERKVDLVDAIAMKNPYFINSVNLSRTTIYAT